MSKAGYCLVNLQSAMAFLSDVQASSLTGMSSQKELDDLIAKKEKELGIVIGERPAENEYWKISAYEEEYSMMKSNM